MLPSRSAVVLTVLFVAAALHLLSVAIAAGNGQQFTAKSLEQGENSQYLAILGLNVIVVLGILTWEHWTYHRNVGEPFFQDDRDEPVPSVDEDQEPTAPDPLESEETNLKLTPGSILLEETTQHDALAKCMRETLLTQKKAWTRPLSEHQLEELKKDANLEVRLRHAQLPGVLEHGPLPADLADLEEFMRDNPWKSSKPWTFADIWNKLEMVDAQKKKYNEAKDHDPRFAEKLSRPHLKPVLAEMFPTAHELDIECALDEIKQMRSRQRTHRFKVFCTRFIKVYEYDTADVHGWLASKSLLLWKGVVVEQYGNYSEGGNSLREWFSFIVLEVILGGLQSYSLPAMTLEHLGSRLRKDSMKWRAWFGGGGLCTILSVWSVLAPHYFASISPSWVLLALALFYAPLVGVLALFIRLTRGDIEWTDIDDFMDHREMRWNFNNAAAIASQVAVLLQMMALTVRVMPTPTEEEIEPTNSTDYEDFKVSLKRSFSTLLFQFDLLDTPDMDYFLLSVWVSVACVLLWWGVFGGLLLRLVMNVGEDGRSVRARFQLYQKLRLGGSVLYTTYTLLSDGLMIPIMSNLMKTMDCTTDEMGIPRLDAKQDWVCWGYSSAVQEAETASCIVDCLANHSTCFNVTDELVAECSACSSPAGRHDNAQQNLATISLLLIIYYIITAFLLAPFIVADSDGIFQPDLLDIRFSARFQLAERAAKLVLTAMTIFFGDRYPGMVLIVQFDVFMSLWHWAETTKPCSVVWMNAVRSSIFSVNAFVSLCVAVDIGSHHNRSPGSDSFIEWVPFVLAVVGTLIILAILARRLVSIEAKPDRHGDLKESYISTSFGPERSDAHLSTASEEWTAVWEFNDVASLRGSSHRLAKLHLELATRHTMRRNDSRIFALRCEYEMDGVPAKCPQHKSVKDRLTWQTEGWEMKACCLDLGEEHQITSFQLLYDDPEANLERSLPRMNGDATSEDRTGSITAIGLSVAVSEGKGDGGNLKEVHYLFGQCPKCRQVWNGQEKVGGGRLRREESGAASQRPQSPVAAACKNCLTIIDKDKRVSIVDDTLTFSTPKACAFFGQLGPEGLFELGSVLQQQTQAERKRTERFLEQHRRQMRRSSKEP